MVRDHLLADNLAVCTVESLRGAKPIERTMTQLADATLQARRQSALASAIAHRALMSVAAASRRRD